MASLIKNLNISPDSWRLVEATDAAALAAVPALVDVIVPLALWRGHKADIRARALGLGVWLDGHDDPSTLIGELADLRVIAIRIPSFTDGRAYSTARLLRERYGYRGELRAIGNVLQDQLWELSQCGFDAFALADGQDPVAALAALKEFSDHYQATAAQPQPLFRRRLLPASSEAA